MKRYKTFLWTIFYFVLSVFWFLAGIAFFAVKFDLDTRYDLQAFLHGPFGTITVYLLGAFSLTAGLIFLIYLIRVVRDHRKFTHASEYGTVQISPYAVQELASEILRKNFKLSSFRINLSHLSDGMKISVRATVRGDTDIGKLSERVQHLLREKLSNQTGLEIKEVDFYAQGVKQEAISEGEKEDTVSATYSDEKSKRGDKNGS